jgi:ATP-dependent Lhr-like helicase
MRLVRTGDYDLRWWTFAGLRANATLAEHLGRLSAAGVVDNFSVPIVPSATADTLERARAKLRSTLPLDPPIPDGAAEGLKFGGCLPPELMARRLRSRLADPETVAACLTEPIAATTLG